MDNERFFAKIERVGECWIWTAAASPHGLVKRAYGKFWYGGRTQQAHRAAYQMFVGPIPDGLTIDHVKDRGCTSTLCVNPDHLEVVTIQENLARGGPGSHNAGKTHCPKGHPYAGTNLITGEEGGRWCAACRIVRNNRRAPCPTCGKLLIIGNIPRHRASVHAA